LYVVRDITQAGKHVLYVKNVVSLGNAVSSGHFSCPLSHQAT